MSLAALLRGTTTVLRKTLPGWTEAEIGIQEDGQPPPGITKRYVAVHPTEWKQGDTVEVSTGIDEVFGLGVTITLTMGAIPRDRVASELFIKSLESFEWLARAIMLTVHQSWQVMTLVNSIIGNYNEGIGSPNISGAGQHLVAQPELYFQSGTPTQITGIPYFIEPLRWRATDPAPTNRTAIWLWAESDDEDLQSIVAQSLTVYFSGARRMASGSLLAPTQE